MNKELFDSMQKQMIPSPQARAALSEKLAQPIKKRPVPWMRYGAVAACAALVIGAYAVYQTGKPEGKAALHSYVTVEGVTGYVQENAAAATGGEEGGVYPPADGGDRDMDMTPEDLEEAMLEVGYTREEIGEYQSIGYQMTWANWWKFVGGQKNSEGDDPFNLDDLKIFSQKELYVNTGALPGGAYIGDIPSQEEAIAAYEKLMDRFDGSYPDWYGGAYIDGSGTLIVQLVEDKDPADKTLELQVLDWAGGRTSRVAFSSCKYSLAQLNELMDRLNALPEEDPVCREVMASWCVDVGTNRIDLTLTEVNDHILIVLAELDPDDDAILVQVGQRVTVDISDEIVSIGSAQTEDPAVHHVMPGGATVPDDEDLIADEPYYDGAHYDLAQLPEEPSEEKRPAFQVQSVPEEDDSASTSSYAPGN